MAAAFYNMEKVDLIYKLNGDFENGIDVFELSPVLLSVGKLIAESYHTLNPQEPQLAINVRPFQAGSFDIQLILHPTLCIQEALHFIRSQQGQDIRTLLEYIGLIGGSITGGTYSLIKLIKWLNGKAKRVAKTQSGDIQYFSETDQSIVVPVKVHALFQNVNIQQIIYNGIGRPFENKEVLNIECQIKDKPDSKLIIEKDIVGACKNYSISEVPSVDAPIENETTISMWIHPHRGSYEGESNSWSFRIVGSNENIKIDNIDDVGFLDKIKNDTYKPSHNDRLHVEILQKQKIQGMKETFTRKIVKVIEIVKSEEQLKLNFHEETDTPGQIKLTGKFKSTNDKPENVA
jgi:hypothetical protein